MGADNITMNQFEASPEKARVTLYATFKVGATGAPTLQQFINSVAGYSSAPSAGWKGVSSITRNSTGKYTVALWHTYQRLLETNITMINTSLVSAPIYQILNDNSATKAAPAVIIQFQSAQGAAADPTNGDVMTLQMTFANSTAP